MKAIIIEDETAALSSLKAVLQQNSVVEIEVIAELESIDDSVEWFQCSLQPDLSFMDIHLADGLAFLPCRRSFRSFLCPVRSRAPDLHGVSAGLFRGFAGGFFGGYETRTIQLHGNQLHLQVEHTIMRKPSDFDMEPDYPLTKEDFIEACEKSTLENGITVTITGTCWMEHNGN